ncbi:MAG: S8 family peptidase, partial [Bacteroidota bacterium]
VVAGLVGLMLSVNPCLSAADVELILKTTALPVDNLPINAAYAGELGAGLIQAEAAVQMAASYVSAFPYQQRLNPSFNHYVACDENMDLRLHVSGFKNSLSTQHQWNLYEQSDTHSALETLSWWQISPNGYNRDTSVFQTALQPHTNYMVKRGVWDGCNPWTERRVYSINAPSCFEQYGYELVALPEANGCMGAYEVRGDSMHLIDRVNFTLQGATTRNYTDNAFPFYQPIDVYGDTQITAVIHFTNGKVYTLAKTIPACDSNLPWRAATEEVTEIATELTIYPNPATGETVQLRHASTATRAIVYSLSGQRLVEQALNSSGTSALPIGSLETGMYVIQVMDEASGSQTLKFQVE